MERVHSRYIQLGLPYLTAVACGELLTFVWHVVKAPNDWNSEIFMWTLILNAGLAFILNALTEQTYTSKVDTFTQAAIISAIFALLEACLDASYSVWREITDEQDVTTAFIRKMFGYDDWTISPDAPSCGCSGKQMNQNAGFFLPDMGNVFQTFTVMYVMFAIILHAKQQTTHTHSCHVIGGIPTGYVQSEQEFTRPATEQTNSFHDVQ